MIARRPFGATGLEVSEIGFGCGPTAGLMVAGDHGARTAVVARALELGVNYFDTAARYGDGASETHLGQVLRDLAAEPVIATKVTLELPDFDDVAAAVEASVEGSLRRLQRDHIDIVHLHNRVGRARASRPNIGSGAQIAVSDILGPRGVAEGLERLRRRGLIRTAGGCAFGGEMAAMRIVVDSGVFASLLVNYSALNPTAFAADRKAGEGNYEGIASLASARGSAVVALRVLEGGRLTGRDPLGDLGFLLDEAGDLAEAAIRFALSNPKVSTVLIGISDMAQLETASAAAGKGPLSARTLAHLGSLNGSDL